MFQNNVPIFYLTVHGTWQSDAIWSYLQTSQSLNLVPHAFQKFMA